MSIDETVSFSLEVNIEKAYEDVRRLQTILSRSLGLIRRMSGNENLDDAIRKIQSMIAYLNTLRLAAAAAQAATGPIGLAMFGITMATTVASTYDLMMDMGP